MSLLRRLNRIVTRSLAIAALAAAAIAAPPSALAQPRHAGGEIVIRAPQFVVHAISFKAVDETGWDWTGSDEVHAVFADFNVNKERYSSTYGDVDAGETKTFKAADRCIAPQPDCSRGISHLHFGIALWERDKPGFPFSGSDFCYGSVGDINLYYKGICSGDDLIGRYETILTQAQLTSDLPNVGDVRTYTVTPKGGSGSYRFTYTITRLPNIERTIVIHDPTDVLTVISLAATVQPSTSGARVRLTWTGASGTNVDIYRNAASLTTTANDGEYIDGPVPSGMYKYVVCNAGATAACSAMINVTVP